MKLCTVTYNLLRGKKTPIQYDGEKICLSNRKKKPSRRRRPRRPKAGEKKKLDSTLQYLHHQHYMVYLLIVTNCYQSTVNPLQYT